MRWSRFLGVVLAIGLVTPQTAAGRTTSRDIGASSNDERREAAVRVIRPPCPSTRGLGLAARPEPARAVATAFLQAMRRPRPDPRFVWAIADRWMRARIGGGHPATLVEVLQEVVLLGRRWRLDQAPARWLDAPAPPVRPGQNVRVRLLEAGVRAYSCPARVIRGLVLATWWFRALGTRCSCAFASLTDVLVVRRGDRYRVFSVH